jgi:hypothetical protein
MRPVCEALSYAFRVAGAIVVIAVQLCYPLGPSILERRDIYQISLLTLANFKNRIILRSKMVGLSLKGYWE